MLVASYLNALKVQFDLVVSSPLKRALQTASLVGTESRLRRQDSDHRRVFPRETVAGFESSGATRDVRERSRGRPQSESARISGLAHLRSSRINIRLRKGAIARIDCTRRPGSCTGWWTRAC